MHINTMLAVVGGVSKFQHFQRVDSGAVLGKKLTEGKITPEEYELLMDKKEKAKVGLLYQGHTYISTCHSSKLLLYSYVFLLSNQTRFWILRRNSSS
jgi:hypothetical protein